MKDASWRTAAATSVCKTANLGFASSCFPAFKGSAHKTEIGGMVARNLTPSLLIGHKSESLSSIEPFHVAFRLASVESVAFPAEKRCTSQLKVKS